MRLVRLEDPSGGFVVELHPQLTVIGGLAAPLRERLVAGVAALPRGERPAGRGVVEVHGLFLDLSTETLELLELHHDVDVVLRARDLPGAQQRAERFAGTAFASSLGPEQTSSAATDDDAVVSARDRLASAESARAGCNVELDAARTLLRELGVERSELLGSIETTRSRLDPFALAGLKVARDELDALEHRAGAVRADAAVEHAALEARLVGLQREADPLRREIARLRAIDPRPVSHALDQLSRARRPVSVPSPQAQQLLGEWQRLVERRALHESRRASSRSHLAEVTARRDQAYDELVEAEQALRAPQLDTKLVDELETVHDELFELDGKTGKIGGAKLRRRMEELRIHESRLLAQLGFDTWSSYVMGVSQGGADLQRAHRFQVAQAAYQLAEEELARAAMSPMVDDPESRELDDLERWLRNRIGEVLGRDPGADPAPALAEARAEVPAAPDSDLDSLMDGLRRALVSTGVDLPPSVLGAAELESVAGGWIEAMSALPDRIGQAEADLDALEREIEALTARVAAGQPAGPAASDPQGPDVVAARARLAEAEARAQAHDEAAELIARMQAHDARLAEREIDLRASVDSAGRRLHEAEAEVGVAAEELRRARELAQVRAAESARVAAEPFRLSAGAAFDLGHDEESPDADADAVEWYVLARMAQQRSLSFVGSVPLVVDDAFAPWGFDEMAQVFARLGRMSEVIQVVYLTEDPAVVSWARSLGEEHAQVVDAGVAAF